MPAGTSGFALVYILPLISLAQEFSPPQGGDVAQQRRRKSFSEITLNVAFYFLVKHTSNFIILHDVHFNRRYICYVAFYNCKKNLPIIIAPVTIQIDRPDR